MSLSDTIAGNAEGAVDTLTRTNYEHTNQIDAGAGVYLCDCSEFAGFVLKAVAISHFQALFPQAGGGTPLAHAYYEAIAALSPSATDLWTRIDALADARRGDLMSWRFATLETGEDTGHVVILAETPTLDAASGAYTVRVYDSAAKPHFKDTRPSATGENGVGSGIVNLKIDGEGRPIAYLFGPPLTGQYAYRDIAIGRAL